MPSETDSGGSEQDWKFDSGDVVREKHAKPSPVPGESEAPKAEYRIKRRLVNPSNGERFYHVELEEGGTHLYSDGVLRQYERIDISQSRVWSEETEVTRSSNSEIEQSEGVGDAE